MCLIIASKSRSVLSHGKSIFACTSRYIWGANDNKQENSESEAIA